jgi:hypothetical protein
MENYKLTRYLYNMVEVKQSLFISMLEKNIDESLFWIFELFYSEFYLECVPYLNDIFEKIYKIENEDLTPFIEQVTLFWNDIDKHDENDVALVLGSYVATLCIRPYNLIKFVNDFLKVKCNKLINPTTPVNMIVKLQEKDIVKYKTIILNNPTKVLKEACKYSLRKNVNELFDLELPSQEEIVNIFNDNWLFYAYKSRIWEKRIIQYGGTPNNEKCTIDFPDDELYEEFTEQWYYDTDEQDIDVKKKMIGIDKQICISDFCKEYNVYMKTKKIIIK